MFECGLTVLPECIRSLRNLTDLFAGGNKLTTVPRWVEELPLASLDLTRSKLEEFPFLHLPDLACLYLGSTGLSQLPCVVRDYYPLEW